jgi:hypothetical protein
MPTNDKKLHEPVFDHNGKPFSPAQILALERAELTRIRVKRDAMILAERREELIETEVVIQQASVSGIIGTVRIDNNVFAGTVKRVVHFELISLN